MGVRDRIPYNLDKRMKRFGVCHGVFGGLLMACGVVARIQVDHWTSIMLVALWTGLMFAATGVIGIIDSNIDNAKPKRFYARDFIVFSVVSFLLSILVVACYAMATYTFLFDIELGHFSWYSYENTHKQDMTQARIICIVILVLAVLEFFLSITSIVHYFDAKKKHNRFAPNSLDNEI